MKKGELTFFYGFDFSLRGGFAALSGDDEIGGAGVIELKPLGISVAGDYFEAGLRVGVAGDITDRGTTASPLLEGLVAIGKDTTSCVIGRLNLGVVAQDDPKFRLGLGVDVPLYSFRASHGYFGLGAQYNLIAGADGLSHQMTFGVSGAFDFSIFNGQPP